MRAGWIFEVKRAVKSGNNWYLSSLEREYPVAFAKLIVKIQKKIARRDQRLKSLNLMK